MADDALAKANHRHVYENGVCLVEVSKRCADPYGNPEGAFTTGRCGHRREPDTRAKAISYLGAVEVAPPSAEPPAYGDRAFTRYAMQSPNGRWHTFYEATLAKFAEGPLNHFRYQVTIGRAFVLMPLWWSPEQRFAWRSYNDGSIRTGPPKGRRGQLAAIPPFQRITADLETGEEIPA